MLRRAAEVQAELSRDLECVMDGTGGPAQHHHRLLAAVAAADKEARHKQDGRCGDA